MRRAPARRALLLALGCAAQAIGACDPSAASAAGSGDDASSGRTPRLAVSTHFAAHDDWRDAIASVLSRPGIARVETIAVAAGRPEWTYFRWPGRRDAWSSAQQRSDEDLLDAATRAFHEAGHRVAAVVDLEAPLYVKAHPDAAATTADGERSAQRVSIAELTGGAYRDALLAMVEALARDHPVDVVELTELGHVRTSFGAADLREYRRSSGASDWPRDARGAIDLDAPSVWAWKTAALGGLVREVAAIVHRHGKLLYVDVPVSWKGLERDGRDAGLDYRRVLEAADRIVVWDYFGLEGVPPEASELLARQLAARLPAGRFCVSFGMWAKEGTLAPEALAEATRAAIRGGARQVWLTPNELVSDAAWRAFLEGAGVDATADRDPRRAGRSLP